MKRNLEVNIADSPELVAKIKSRNDYAQSLYLTMRNMRWQRSETFPIERNDIWSGVANIVFDLRSDFSVDESYVSHATVTLEILNDIRQLGWYPMPWQD